jgi:PLP dependent protein
MSETAAHITENLARVRQQIADAAARSGRSADEITLVGVTKYVTAEVARPLAEAGCLDLGESRPQQLWDKAAALADLPIRWHAIGHLQRNKARRTAPLATLIHSVDSPRLLEALEEACTGPLSVLLEVNISGESAKHGFAPGQIEPVLAELPVFRHVAVRGLMCMAGLEGGLDEARRDFSALRELRDRLRACCPPQITLEELSMGMSGDFQVAIEEGATIVRVGSALFEGV